MKFYPFRNFAYFLRFYRLYTGLIPSLAPSQWETSLQSNAVSHWLDANLESTLCIYHVYMYLCWRNVDGVDAVHEVGVGLWPIWGIDITLNGIKVTTTVWGTLSFSSTFSSTFSSSSSSSLSSSLTILPITPWLRMPHVIDKWPKTAMPVQAVARVGHVVQRTVWYKSETTMMLLVTPKRHHSIACNYRQTITELHVITVNLFKPSLNCKCGQC